MTQARLDISSRNSQEERQSFQPPDSAEGATVPTASVVESDSTDSGVSPSQVIAAAMASVTAAVAGSKLGVAGTVIGAALASVIATVGSAFYSAWLRRGRELALRTAKAGGGHLPTALPVSRLAPRLQELPWKRIAVAAVASLALGIAALTAVESLAGRPVLDREGGGSTWGKVTGGGPEEKAPVNPQGPQDGPVEEPSGEPTDEPTAEPTEEPTQEPTDEVTDEPTEEPTQEPTGEPTQEPTEDPAPIE